MVTYTVFFLWVVLFRFKSSNHFKSCSEGVNDPLFPEWKLGNEISFDVNLYKHIQDEHAHGKKYYKQIWMTDAVQAITDYVISHFKKMPSSYDCQSLWI